MDTPNQPEQHAEVVDDLELDLSDDVAPIIIGKRTLMELASLSLTIAEDMSS